MDVKITFLNGKLKEEILHDSTKGCTIYGQENKVWKLHKSLYVLKQAPK